MTSDTHRPPQPPAHRRHPAQEAKARLSDAAHRTLHRLSPLLLVRYRYLRATGRWYPRHQPATFDEKLLWLMLYWHHPLKPVCADKYEVRHWAASRLGPARFPDLYGVYDSPADIDVTRLPDRFALKATHGCGFNLFCRDKAQFDMEAARRTLARWLADDQGGLFGEAHYSLIRPRVVCEELLEVEPGRLPDDYKFFCFHGQVHCVMACTGRTAAGANYDFYDPDWSRKLPYSRSSILAGRHVPRPAAFEQMLEAARALSQPFPFVRVDLYSVRGRAVFGELTFSPHGGIDKGLTEVAQRTMGERLQLPAPLPPGPSPLRGRRRDHNAMPAVRGE